MPRVREPSPCLERLNRMRWGAGVAIELHGVRIGVRTSEAAMLERLLGVLPLGWSFSRSSVVGEMCSFVVGGSTAGSKVKRFHLAYIGSTKVSRTMDLDQALGDLRGRLQLQVAREAPRKVFVHAGVVGWKGRAIVIPGRSFSGKTTLVRELLRAGATYYSDEYAIFDRRGLVHPYPLPLGVRDGAGHKPPPTELLLECAGTRPLPLGLVVVSRYKSGASWRPRAVSAGHGALALVQNSISVRSRPALALRVFGRALLTAAIVKGVRGEADEAADSILRMTG
jgi:hypothetical protein